MIIKDIIDAVDALKPNPYSDDQKTAWLSRCEGQIQTECYLMPIENVLTYVYTSDDELTPLAPAPYDKLYESYLFAMLDYYQGEYGKYANSMAMFNKDISDLTRWLTRLYEPTKRSYRGEIAAKVAYTNTVAALLTTLPPGAYLYFVSCNITTAFDSGTSDVVTLKDEDGNTLMTVDGQVAGITKQAVCLMGDKGLYGQVVSEGTASTEGSATFGVQFFWLQPGCKNCSAARRAACAAAGLSYCSECEVATTWPMYVL